MATVAKHKGCVSRSAGLLTRPIQRRKSAESDYGGFESTAWGAVFGPARLPAASAVGLADEIQRIVSSDSFRSTLEPLGVIPTALSGSAFVEVHRSESVKWGKAVHGSGATL